MLKSGFNFVAGHVITRFFTYIKRNREMMGRRWLLFMRLMMMQTDACQFILLLKYNFVVSLHTSPHPLSFFCVWVSVWVCVCVSGCLLVNLVDCIPQLSLSIYLAIPRPSIPKSSPVPSISYTVLSLLLLLQSYNYNTKQNSVVKNGRKTGNRVVHFSCFRKFSSLNK